MEGGRENEGLERKEKGGRIEETGVEENITERKQMTLWRIYANCP